MLVKLKPGGKSGIFFLTLAKTMEGMERLKMMANWKKAMVKESTSVNRLTMTLEMAKREDDAPVANSPKNGFRHRRDESCR